MPRRLFLAALLLPFLSGCGGGVLLTKEELAAGSVVFAYLDTDEMSGDFEWFSLRQLRQGEAPQYWSLGVEGNYAYHLGIPKGSYQVDSYGGSDGFNAGCIKLCSSTRYSYRIPSQGHGFRIEKRGVYFLGAFRHKKAGGLFDAKFDVERLKHPTEKEATEAAIEAITKANKGDLDRIEPSLRLLKAHLKSL